MKKKITLTILLISVLSASAILLSGCTTFDNFKEAFFEDGGRNADTVKIGVFEPQTGNDSQGAGSEILGIELACEVAPKVLDKEVQLVFADTQSSIYTAETAIQDLLAKQPTVILGPYGDAASVVAAPYVEKAKVPAITITATNPLITANNSFYFRTSFVEDSQGIAIADYIANKLKLKSALVIRTKDDDTTTSMVSKFENKLNKLTGQDESVKSIMEVPMDETYYGSYIKKIKASKCKAIFMPVDITTATKIIEEANKEKLYNVVFILPKELHSDELLTLQNNNPKVKIAVTSDFASNAKVDTTYHDQLLKIYQEKYGKDAEPDDAVALGFDAYMIAIKAIERAGSVDGEFVRNALVETKNFEGASGEITFNESGNPTKPINIDVIRKGKYQSVYTVK